MLGVVFKESVARPFRVSIIGFPRIKRWRPARTAAISQTLHTTSVVTGWLGRGRATASACAGVRARGAHLGITATDRADSGASRTRRNAWVRGWVKICDDERPRAAISIGSLLCIHTLGTRPAWRFPWPSRVKQTRRRCDQLPASSQPCLFALPRSEPSQFMTTGPIVWPRRNSFVRRRPG